MRLNFHQQGQGQPLIILHGLFGSLDNWQRIAEALSDKFRVISADLRNHGSSPHSDEMSLSAMAGDVRTLLDGLGLKEAMALGHSLGGKVAMQLALETPERVAKLVVADIAPRPYPPWHLEILDALLSLKLEKFKSRPEIEQTLAKDLPSLPLRKFLLKNLRRNEDGSFVWKIPLPTIKENYALLNQSGDFQGAFEKSTLFVRGGPSEYITRADQKIILKLFPRAKIETIPEAGHWLHAEKPEEFIRIVRSFLLAT
jgi:pimeloyl-ACP methyl ester carboxylesterase